MIVRVVWFATCIPIPSKWGPHVDRLGIKFCTSHIYQATTRHLQIKQVPVLVKWTLGVQGSANRTRPNALILHLHDPSPPRFPGPFFALVLGLVFRTNKRSVCNINTPHVFTSDYSGSRLTQRPSGLAMKVPLELVEEIIGYIPKSDLRSCSLVTKSWSNLCRKHLFEAVDIHPGNSERWLDGISPANVELLECVRALTYSEYSPILRNSIWPAYHTLREYSPSFRRLSRLTLCFSHISPPTFSLWLEVFSTFQHTLSHITLGDCTTTKRIFVTLINFFPNLVRLDVHHIEYYKEDKPIPPLVRPGFKRLCVTQWFEMA